MWQGRQEVYPHVAAIRGNEREWKVLFLFLTRLLAAGCLPAVALSAAASGPIFTGLLSEKWTPVAPIFVLVAPATAVQPVTALIGTFLMATGRTDVQFRLSVRYAAMWLVGLLLAVGHGVEFAPGGRLAIMVRSKPACDRLQFLLGRSSNR